MAEETEKKKVSLYGTDSLDRLNTASTNLDQHLTTRPQAYQNKYEGQINSAMDAVLNRKPFQYDVNGDALYKQYAEQYQRNGKLAMRDTVAQGAALTGGYDNSYAQNVGQQAYQGYMQQLTDRIPELYKLALDKYDREAANAEKQYALLSDRENQDYSRYNDQLSTFMTDRDYYQGAYDTAYNQAMATGDALYNRILALAPYGYTPTEAELSAMGMTAAQWAAFASQYAPAVSYGGGDDGGGGGSRKTDDNPRTTGGTGYLATEAVKAAQKDGESAARDYIGNSGATAQQQQSANNAVTGYLKSVSSNAYKTILLLHDEDAFMF